MKIILWALALATSLAVTGPAQAQQWPSKPIILITPFAAGASTGLMAQLVAEKLTTALGHNVLVDYRAGAGGTIGTMQISKAAPDGYTLGLSTFTTHVLGPLTNKQATKFDPINDFTHIAYLGGVPYVLVVHPSLPVKTVKEFLDLSRSRPGGISIGSPGVGTLGHLNTESMRLAGANVVHVAYKGSNPAAVDLIANHIPAAFMTIVAADAFIKAGQVKLIATTSGKRLAAYPNIPTFAEEGYAQWSGITWTGISGPPNMPKPIVDRLSAEIRKTMLSAPVQAQFTKDAMESEDLDPRGFTALIAREYAQWKVVIDKLGPLSP